MFGNVEQFRKIKQICPGNGNGPIILYCLVKINNLIIIIVTQN